MQDLTALQRRLWQLISAPDGVRAALEAEAGAGEHPAHFIAGDAPLDAVRRLEVYANAYFERIHACLARDYGALAAALGEAGFHDLVTAYLIAHPSRHPSLRFVGAALPDYLANAGAAQPFRRRWPWAADLARFEWALGSAFDAADAPTLEREALAELSPAAWAELVLAFHPSLALVETRWPVAPLYAAWAAGAALAPPQAPQPAQLCVWRREEQVRQRALDPLEAALLGAARGGATFGELCAHAAERLGGERAPAAAAGWLARWVDDGLVCAVGRAGAAP